MYVCLGSVGRGHGVFSKGHTALSQEMAPGPASGVTGGPSCAWHLLSAAQGLAASSLACLRWRRAPLGLKAAPPPLGTVSCLQ